MEPICLTKQQVKRFFIRYQHLTDDTALTNQEDILSFIRKVGCIQFDPIDVVGRNPDLVLQARCPTYKRGEIDRLLYEEKKLFDVYDKCMSICPVEEYPYFARRRESSAHYLDPFQEEIKDILTYLKENEYANNNVFDFGDKIDWYWAPQKKSRVILDSMHYCGLVTVHHREKGRRHFSLSERYFGGEIANAPDPNETLEEYHDWAVLRRINSVGMLRNVRSDAFLGIVDLKSKARNDSFCRLEKEGKIISVEIEGCKTPYYIDVKNLSFLKEAIDTPIPKENTRILAPLDNLMWDRTFIEELFGFYYRWEVYVPEKKREYGYYVLPILCAEEIVARIEMKTDRKTNTLFVHNLWFEKGVNPSEFRTQIRDCIQHMKRYNFCKRVTYKGNPFTKKKR